MSDASTPRSVLVLEDSILVALAIEEALAERGFDAIIAGSLAAAEERLGTARPAAALIDLNLPDGTALDLARTLHAQGCPVALSTGIDADGVPSEPAFAVQFRKPVSASSLAEWVAGAAIKGVA